MSEDHRIRLDDEEIRLLIPAIILLMKKWIAERKEKEPIRALRAIHYRLTRVLRGTKGGSPGQFFWSNWDFYKNAERWVNEELEKAGLA